MMNVNNMIINRTGRAWMENKTTGAIMFNLLDTKEASLEVSGEQVFATNSVGQKLAGFDRGTEAKFNCQSSMFDINLLAAQTGAEKVVGTAAKKVVAPKVELLPVSNLKKVTLGLTPVEGSVKLGLVRNDGSVEKWFALGSVANATDFSIAGKTISLPTDPAVKEGASVFIKYEAEYEEAVGISKSTDNKPMAGRFIQEVLFADPCDITVEYYGYLIFPNGKLVNEINVEFNVEAAQQFSIEAMQDWCSTEKKLFDMVIVGNK